MSENIFVKVHRKMVEDLCEQEDKKFFALINLSASVAIGGVTCKKCNGFNEYCTSPSESDGSHICYKCRSGF